MARSRVKEDTLLILDLSDLKKMYAEKMEHMATVRDGSDHGELVHGYWTNQVIAAHVGSDQITPLHFSLYSQASPEFTGENNQIIKAMDQVGRALENKGIWVIDRGGDRDALFEPLLQNKRDFIVRLVGSRDFIYQGNKARSLWLAFACRSPYNRSFVRLKQGKEVHVRFCEKLGVKFP